MDTSVLIATFHRNDLLERLLRACAVQTGLTPGSVEWIVVDNAPDAPARDRVATLAEELDLPVRYFHETQAGLAHARNRGIAEARGEWLVFIDDDEAPAADWLARLRAACDQFDADVVFGPVFPELAPSDSDVRDAAAAFFTQNSHAPAGAPMVRGTPFNRRFRRGVCTRVMASNNVIFRADHARALGPTPVDPDYGQYGGSDQIFFEQMLQVGATRRVWCPDAKVYEHIPAERQSREYLLKRSFRHGQMETNNALAFSPPRVGRLIKSVVIGMAQTVIGAAMMWAPWSQARRFRGRRLYCVGLGRVLFFGSLRTKMYG